MERPALHPSLRRAAAAPFHHSSMRIQIEPEGRPAPRLRPSDRPCADFPGPDDPYWDAVVDPALYPIQSSNFITNREAMDMQGQPQ